MLKLNTNEKILSKKTIWSKCVDALRLIINGRYTYLVLHAKRTSTSLLYICTVILASGGAIEVGRHCNFWAHEIVALIPT